MINFISTIIATLTLTISHFFYYYPCDTPIAYHVGTIDSRFNISETQAMADIETAAQYWNDAWGKPLLKEDPKATLTVNFVYDQRQELTNKLDNLENSVTQDKAALAQKVAAFNQKTIDLQNKVTALNNEINDWNSRGGAPGDIFNQLTARQKELQNEISQNQAEAKSLNVSVHDFNLQVDNFNSTVSTFNNLVAQKPEEGLFDGQNQTISIYYVLTDKELRHTLIHEFGHALGVNHVASPDAIMYPYSSQTTKITNEDIKALEMACKRLPRFTTNINWPDFGTGVTTTQRK